MVNILKFSIICLLMIEGDLLASDPYRPQKMARRKQLETGIRGMSAARREHLDSYRPPEMIQLRKKLAEFEKPENIAIANQQALIRSLMTQEYNQRQGIRLSEEWQSAHIKTACCDEWQRVIWEKKYLKFYEGLYEVFELVLQRKLEDNLLQQAQLVFRCDEESLKIAVAEQGEFVVILRKMKTEKICRKTYSVLVSAAKHLVGCLAWLSYQPLDKRRLLK